MSKIILADRGDEQKIIEEEKVEWINNVLVALGIDKQILGMDNEKVIEYLTSQNIEIFEYKKTNSIEIIRNNKKVAEWKEPKLMLKKDKKYYYEIHLNEWALPLNKKTPRRK